MGCCLCYSCELIADNNNIFHTRYNGHKLVRLAPKFIEQKSTEISRYGVVQQKIILQMIVHSHRLKYLHVT